MIKIQCFGIIKDLVGASSIPVSDVPETVGDLRAYLTKAYPSFNGLSSWMIAVNQSYAEDQTALNVNDEVALIPPVSGG